MSDKNAMSEHSERLIVDEPPPFLKRWPNVYRFVLIYLACVITLFYIFTAAYKP